MHPWEVFFERIWLFRCRVKILIVTDSSGGFGDVASFHLGHALQVLAADPWPHVQFDVTKAHRQAGGAPDVLSNFRFDAHDLSVYSQIWLFGIATSGDALSAAELRKLSEFMDGGGGVFATGDHQNLGQPMCAEVPRVRSMRRWYFPNPGPNGEPVAPDQTGVERHDTVMDLAGGGSQSDKTPQPIHPRLYTRVTGGGIIRRVERYPHPVLCGPDGTIAYLPDHMHEGLCEVPADLSRSWTFSGYTSVEYPTVAGVQERPQVIAWATTRNTDGSEFGVLAAYDGHRANVGRVVVDATWHHWFNINLIGFLDATDPASPAYDPAIVPKWESIKAYFRNVALWLARPPLQGCLRNGGWIWTCQYHDIRITFRPLETVRDRLDYYWQLGTFARDAMGRLAPQCQTTSWILRPLLERLPIRLDPWAVIPKPPLPDPPPWLSVPELETVALGGAVHELLSRFHVVGEGKDLGRVVEEVDALVSRGAATATAAFLERYESAGRDAGQFLRRLKERGTAE